MFKKRFFAGLGFMIVLLLPLFGLLYLMNDEYRNPAAKEGVLDLRDWNFARDGTVALSGEWEFYRSQLLGPEHFAESASSAADRPVLTGIATVPGQWNKYIAEDGEPAETGYATFRLLVKLSGADNGIYGIETTNIRTANRVFMAGSEIGAGGVPGESAETTTADNTPYVGFTRASGDTMEIIVQVSNYSYASGGMIYPLVFGDQRSVMQVRERNIFGDLMTSAGFLIPGLFFLFLYRIRREEVSLRYLGLFCLTSLIYVLTHGEKLLGGIIPGFPYELFLRIQLISSVLVHYYLMRYVSVIVSRRISPKLLLIFRVSTVLMLLVPVFLPTIVFSRIDVPYFSYSFIVVIYVAFVLLRDMKHRSKDVIYVLMSVQSISVIILVSILNVVGLLSNQMLLPIEMLIFVIAQALLLAGRFAHSFREVEQLSQRLLTLDGLKDEFMANTSHELRTPLHGIVNIAESLLAGAGGTLNAKQESDLSMVVSTGKRLSLLINDILDFSRLKNGDIVLQRQAVDLKSVATSVLEVIGHMTGKKEIRLVQQWPESLPLLDTDENRLQQILFNLLGNALKFTRQGEIRIYAEVVGAFVKISVADTGIGIAKERFATLFRSFDETDTALEMNHAGTGLGLSITKKLVELNGGEIGVESEPDRGSVFYFTIPAAVRTSQAERKPAAREVAVSAHSIRPGEITPVIKKGPTEYTVLVVDDDLVNLQVMYNLLSVDNCAVLVADNGEEALAQLSRSPQLDCVIVDWMMPGMSGLELCRKIRERYSLSELPVLMLTARSRPEDVQAGFQAGVNDYLSKPVDAPELRARIRTLLELRKSVQTAIRTEMAFLQAQIKPHFLYNAMNTIIAICPVDPAKATHLLIELSQYLRASFDFQNRERLTYLEKELELVKSYLQLEKARFDERLRVEYDIGGNMRSLIPPLTIQPIVENAVRHGIMRKSAGGTVRISVREADNRVTVVVSDDGMGMTPERLNEVLSDKAGSGVGLRNIHGRLLTLYGRGLQIDSEWKRGTTVRFELPADYEADGRSEDA
ncbi:response regulator [Paenibacillus hemerocallicola]|uniref:histidine kinase n=1 Tax=Paenibacillus hemerocallicola TaxID=1172614 RepID=A0A5C4SXY3_9BACL|nr:ATP-binding protein [Paenibacillus hemerocallicola]TNJ61226.1 response regulator [Paenibacillus hemerocallicola]